MQDAAPTAKPIEIFKPGDHTTMAGETIPFTAADLAAAAAAYDPALSEAPLVVGHPKINDPAYGWAERLEFKDGILFAVPKQVEPAFAKIVNEGRYKRISPRWHRPDSPGNPKPGTWYLDHIGFLGAHAPAVAGLKPASFAASDDAGLVEFGVSGLSLARLFRGFRDWLISDRGIEVADKVLPEYELQNLEIEGVREMDASLSPAYARPETEISPVTTPTNPGAPSADDLARREQAVKDAERKIATIEYGAHVETLIADGKVRPVDKDFLTSFMASLPPDATVSFGAGDAATTQPTLGAFKSWLSGLPKMVEFGEVARPQPQGPDATAAFAAPAGYAVDPDGAALYQKTLQYQAAHPGVSFESAYAAVGGK